MRSKDARKGEGFTQVKITSRDHLLRVLTLTNKGPRGISIFCFSEKLHNGDTFRKRRPDIFFLLGYF